MCFTFIVFWVFFICSVYKSVSIRVHAGELLTGEGVTENCLVQVGELLRMENSMHRDRHSCRAEMERPRRSATPHWTERSVAPGMVGENGRHCSQAGTIPWNLPQSPLRDAGRSRSQSVPYRWHKTLRSFWGKMPSAEARQQRKTVCRSPGQETLLPSGLWETGRKNPFLLRVLPASSTGITSSQVSQVKYFHSPPPSS